jgi:two-component system sensor histidine kinase QseC
VKIWRRKEPKALQSIFPLSPFTFLPRESADEAYRVQIAESIPKRDHEALEIAVRTVQPVAWIFPLLLLAIYLSVRRVLKPLDHLATEVATRSSDNLTPLAGHDAPREAQPLVAAINRLLKRLGQSLENERRFTADAAHELRTPLAAARGRGRTGRPAARASRWTWTNAPRRCRATPISSMWPCAT